MKGFTLIELLIVIAVLAILATVVILVINPAQLLAQSRDSRRLSEFQTLNKALQLAELRGVSLGQPNIVYVSLPSTLPLPSNCSDLGLPPLPSGWSYQCSNSANYRKVDSTGWVPVNFAGITIGSPLSVLPIDPINEASTGNYYIYVTGGSYKLTALMESEKYANKMAKDGGSDVGLYEIGTNLNLANFQRGLTGYWKFDEEMGTLSDLSGWNNNGTQSGGVTYGATGKVGDALSFDGVDDYVSASDTGFPSGVFPRAASLWAKPSVVGDGKYHVAFSYGSSAANQIFSIGIDGGNNRWYVGTGGPTVYSNTAVAGQWIYLAVTFDGITYRFYENGTQTTSGTMATNTTPSGQSVIGDQVGDLIEYLYPFNGLIDDVRIYNRTLSAAEISAIYNATK